MASTALAIAGILGAAGSVGGAAIQSNAAGNAASTQADAAEYAAKLQAELGQESLGLQENQYEQGQANLEPFLQSGANSESTLDYLLGLAQPTATSGTAGQTLSIPGVNGTVSIPGVTPLKGAADTNLGAYGSLLAPYSGGPFVPPTAAQAAQSPGEQFALQQGENAINSGAAANGSLLTGGTLNAEDQFAQNLASTNYNNVYNQALQTYGTNYNTWANQNTNTFNRLAALAGMGQTSAQQLNTLGANTANSESSILGNVGSEVGQDTQNAAAATASGYIGSANAWGGALGGVGSNATQLLLLNNLLQNQSGNAYQSIWNAEQPTGWQTTQPTITAGVD